VLVDVLNNCTKKNGECFATAGRGVYQATIAIDDMLPGFFLECKRLPAL